MIYGTSCPVVHICLEKWHKIFPKFNSHQLSYSNVFQAHFQSRGRDFAIDRNVLKFSKNLLVLMGGKVKKSQNSLVIFMTFCQIFRSILSLHWTTAAENVDRQRKMIFDYLYGIFRLYFGIDDAFLLEMYIAQCFSCIINQWRIIILNS